MIHLPTFIESSGYLGQYFTFCPFRSTSGKQGTRRARRPSPILQDASAFAAESLSMRRADMVERLT
jgi:hypothetical protein